ncbi:toprim domain-containing protein [Mycoplasmopsis gallinarum]|uniref:hypothetical protein n=1 Tax=Mycoplasmopsis gallinarum TaxID=29557 RepID=UPI000489D081|nr:hypothetical protein [Mycoplasmopsis gallinarum]
MIFKEIEELKQLLVTIPGVSKKQSEKIVKYFIDLNEKKDIFLNDLITKLENLKSNIVICEKCNFLKNSNLCFNCEDTKKDNLLMIVENINVANKIDEIGFFDGFYFVLNEKELKIKNDAIDLTNLINFVKSKPNLEEIIIVLSPTLDGLLISKLIQNKLSAIFPNLIISTNSIGMPVGSNIDYLDEFTIKESITNRKNKGVN